MTIIDKLLMQFCPNGVEYKTLGELGTFLGGLSGKSKEDFKNGNAKFITYMNVFNNIQLKLDVTDSVKINEGEKQNTIQYGDVLFTGSSETPNECGMSSVLTEKTDEKLYLNSFCFIYRFDDPELFLPSFSKYLFRSEALRKQIIKTASGVTRFNVSKAKMAKVKIPVPPLEVQSEIVKILDNFTELTAELSEELTARKKQYEYYRDLLLNLDVRGGGQREHKWRKIKLLDMLSQPITDGPHTTPTFVDKGIPFVSVDSVWDGKIHFENMRGYITEEFDLECCKKYKPQKHDVYMVKSGSTTGKVAYVDTDERFNIWSPLAAMRVNEHHSSRYLFHLLQTNHIQELVKTKSSHGSQPNLSMRELEKFEVIVPPLEEQTRIVNILDRFDKLCNDICEGMPAEIEARRKQYEYYRDKLLTFKEV